jgi:hypothetical protein
MKDSSPLAVITEGPSDILDLIQASALNAAVIRPDELSEHDLDPYRSIIILGGTGDKPLRFFPRENAKINQQILKGKRVFSEFCQNAGLVYLLETHSTRYERPVFVSDTTPVDGLAPGDILDEQCNTRISLWRVTYTGRPLLQYIRNAEGYHRVEVTESLVQDRSASALWFQEPNLLICSFRLANYIKGRFAPAAKWKYLVCFILEWVSGQHIDPETLADTYYQTSHFEPFQDGQSFEEQVRSCIRRAIGWFQDADMLIRRYGVTYGVSEGMGAAVYPDGSQQWHNSLRLDCTGEAALAFLMHSLLEQNQQSRETANQLLLIFRDLEIRADSPFDGMNVLGLACYQDDCARGSLLPILFRCLYTGSQEDLPMVIRSLRFLVRTTGTDGLRVLRTDLRSLHDDQVDCMGLESFPDGDVVKWRWTSFQKTLSQLSSEPANTPSAHYNGYYLASLLLAAKITGDPSFRETGIRGMETLMAAYPETAREQSETEELCRLILPLSMLYWVSGDAKHRGWLYQVTADLQSYRHATGSYLEWDTGYTAVCSNKKDGECSVLSSNGDPVVDMLYSINWLPVGFIQAWWVTRDPYFKSLWADIARFFVSSQVHSSNRQINGAWTRALDVELMEVYGVPNDVGWAPWSIESGWTVGEIAAGLAMGLLADQLADRYSAPGEPLAFKYGG